MSDIVNYVHHSGKNRNADEGEVENRRHFRGEKVASSSSSSDATTTTENVVLRKNTNAISELLEVQ